VKVAFDSRAGANAPGEHYARRLLRALRDTAGERDEILETHRPRGAEVFHAPWVEGAMLRSPCPMVVTVHDVVALTRRSERLRCGGVHLRLRHLALQRATHVIVPTEAVACEAVAELELERERVIVIPSAGEPTTAGSPSQPQPAAPAWTWEDAGRETWRVYGDAVAQPERAFLGSFSRRRGARAPRGPSSAEL
jgi:Glycosyl transferase 4-like domain